MARTFNGPPDRRPEQAGREPAEPPATCRPTWRERAIVLGGFALAALYTAVAAAAGADLETAGAAWLAAVLWTVPASLACVLWRGIRRRDWSAFRRYELRDGRDERIDWASRTGRYAYLRIAEEHERLLRGD